MNDTFYLGWENTWICWAKETPRVSRASLKHIHFGCSLVRVCGSTGWRRAEHQNQPNHSPKPLKPLLNINGRLTDLAMYAASVWESVWVDGCVIHTHTHTHVSPLPGPHRAGGSHTGIAESGHPWVKHNARSEHWDRGHSIPTSVIITALSPAPTACLGGFSWNSRAGEDGDREECRGTLVALWIREEGCRKQMSCLLPLRAAARGWTGRLQNGFLDKSRRSVSSFASSFSLHVRAALLCRCVIRTQQKDSAPGPQRMWSQIEARHVETITCYKYTIM